MFLKYLVYGFKCYISAGNVTFFTKKFVWCHDMKTQRSLMFLKHPLGFLSCFIQSPSWKYCTLDFRSQKFPKVSLNKLHKVSSKFTSNEQRQHLFIYFIRAFLLRKKSHVGKQLKIGLSAAGNTQARFHFQSKLSSDVEPVCFLRTKTARYFFFL